MEERNSCNLEVQSGQDFFCDCFKGICGRLCKQSVGLLYKTGTIKVDHDVRSKPLGVKRKRGRPKKLPSCLTRNPKPAKSGDAPFASVFPIRPSPTSPSSIILNLSLSSKRSREPSSAPEPWAESLTISTALLPPPAMASKRLRNKA